MFYHKNLNLSKLKSMTKKITQVISFLSIFIKLKMAMKFITMLLLFGAIQVSAVAGGIVTLNDLQQKTVSGRVLDSKGNSMPGVSVVEKGTINGTITDVTGKFTVSVTSEKSILVFSFIGYTSQEVTVGNQNSLEITLVESASTLNEFVVIGYGSTTKKEITGSVSVVKAKQISKMPVSSAIDILQGLTAGVTVSQSSGTPGSASVLHIRGIGSINGSTDPLYVVDGLPQNDINYLNPNDIESIAVHKDASVAAIYGARAANGVIIVTTKTGSVNEKVNFTYDTYLGMQSAWRRPEMLNAEEFITYKNLAATNAGAELQPDFSSQVKIDSVLRFVTANTGQNGTDWWNKIVNKGAPIQSHNFSVSGGSKTVSFSSSLGYLTQKGIINGSDYKRISWRNNINAQVSNRVKISANIGIIDEERQTIDENNPFTGTIFCAMTADPITPVFRNNLVEVPSYLSKINYGYEPSNPFSQYSGILYSDKRNPVAQINRMEQTKYTTLGIKGGFNIDIKIAKPLFFQSRIGMDLGRAFTDAFNPQYTLNSYEYSTYATVSNYTYNSNYFVLENTLNFDQTWGNYHVTALGGFSEEATNVALFSASIQGLVNNDVDMRIINAGTINPAVSGYNYSNAIRSYFGRAGFDYAGRYIFAFNIRRDGSSQFAEGNQWGTFPSVSAAWRFTEEGFLQEKQLGWLTDGKLRASYGQIGNQNIGGGAYLSTYGNTFGRYLFGNETSAVIGAGRLSTGNPVLQWEVSNQLDIGLDLAFLKGKVNFTVDYFDKKIENMLLIVPLPTTLGYPNSPYSNAGNMQNTGWEFDLSYRNAEGDLTYSFDGNISAYRNKVTKLGDGEPIYATAHLGEVITKTEVGMPVGYYYGYVTNGIFQNAQQVEDSPQRDVSTPGDVRFKDLNGDGVLDAKDRTMIGNPWPNFVYGFTANLGYKGFDFSLFLQGSQGNDVMNIQKYDTESGTGFYNATKGFIDKSWSGEGSTDQFHKISQNQGLNNSVSDYFVEDGSYLRIKNLQLGYTFTNKLLEKAKITQLRFYVGAQNLLTLTGYSGLDPEIGSSDPKLTGIDQGYYPQARTLMTGINLKF